MREYGQVQCAFWGHPDIVGLSDEAKLLALYLLTGPNSNGLGCYRLPLGYAQEDLGWSSETLSRGFHELFEAGFSKRCETTRYILLPAFLRWNPISNANVAKARVKEFEEIPKQFSYLAELADSMLVYGQHWPEPFSNLLETVAEPLRNPSETLSNSRARPDPDPDPTQTLTPTPTQTRSGPEREGARANETGPVDKSGNGKSKPRSAQGERLPDDWMLTANRLQEARRQGLTDEQAQREADKFVDHWRSTPGQKGRKSDWEATWRNWCRRAMEQQPSRPRAGAQQNAETAQRWAQDRATKVGEGNA